MIFNRLCNLLGVLALSTGMGTIACTSTSGNQGFEQEVMYVDEEGNPIDVSSINLDDYEIVEEQESAQVDVADIYAPEAGVQEQSVAIEMDDSTEGELKDMLSGVQSQSVVENVEDYDSEAVSDSFASQANDYDPYNVDVVQEAESNSSAQSDGVESYGLTQNEEPKKASQSSQRQLTSQSKINVDGANNAGSYVVKLGDTLSHIAERVYGSFRKWPELAAFNQLKNPHMIYVGEVIHFNTDSAVASASGSATQESVVVQKGDTLSSISQRIFGTPDNWKYLATTNKNVVENPHKIEVGTRLVFNKEQAVTVQKRQLQPNDEVSQMPQGQEAQPAH